MSVQQQLIIFARAPLYGRVKRRLARDIGHERALEFYTDTLAGLLAELRDGPWALTVATDTRAATTHPVFHGVETMAQPKGDLGHRMVTVLRRFAGQPCVLIGSDIPSVRQSHIQSAFRALHDAEVVFGPACDGGFWLVGASAEFLLTTREPGGFMRGVQWSTAHSLRDTLNTLPEGCRVETISTLADVDDGDAYRRYVSAAGSNDNKL
ncbi:MAG: TIGR04282 family arsenosugar biosynthesis glycosyltransferase [Pseudomonadota bacterium]